MPGIGRRLKEERLRLKLSQNALGTVGGVETNAQGNYESGTRYPRADYLSRISRTGVDITYVVTGLRLPEETLVEAAHLPPSLPVCEHPCEQSQETEELPSLVQRLQGNLHGITTDLYHISRLADTHPESGQAGLRKTQLETIKNEAETIAMATLRLIFVTSRLH